MRYPIVFWDSGGTIFHFGDPPGGYTDPSPRDVAAGRADRTVRAMELFGRTPPDNIKSLLSATDEKLKAELGAHYSFESLAAELYREAGWGDCPEETLIVADAIGGPRYRSWLWEGVAECLAALDSAGVAMGVIADTTWTSRMMSRAFQGVGLLRYFRTVTCSCDLGVMKPNAEIFRAARDAIGVPAADGARVLYVGDSIPADIKGATAFGWDAALHKIGDASSDGVAAIEFIDYRKLVELVLG